jgi:glycosyltransferase involved in cell wall biosynthesis
VRAEGVLGRVHFTGFLANPFPVMEAADIVLVCSRKEGFGRVAVEAMRLGKPVVAAASGAILELVEDGFNGLLYTPGDHQVLADKLLNLLQSRSLRTKLGENGRRSVQRFSLSTFGDAVLRQFDAVLRCGMV